MDEMNNQNPSMPADDSAVQPQTDTAEETEETTGEASSGEMESTSAEGEETPTQPEGSEESAA